MADDGFLTTRWSLIFAAQQRDPQSGALNTICELYLNPIYFYIRRRGYDRDAAHDLTQAFFAHFLEKNVLQAADRDRGKFRAFLLGCLKNFLSHQHERNLAQKRGGNVRHVSFDSATAERLYQLEPADEETPEELFARRWALELLDTTLEKFKFDCEKRGKKELFHVLEPFLEWDDDANYEKAAAQLGMTVIATRTAVSRLRADFIKLARELFATMVPSADHVDDELRYLLRVLSR